MSTWRNIHKGFSEIVARSVFIMMACRLQPSACLQSYMASDFVCRSRKVYLISSLFQNKAGFLFAKETDQAGLSVFYALRLHKLVAVRSAITGNTDSAPDVDNTVVSLVSQLWQATVLCWFVVSFVRKSFQIRLCHPCRVLMLNCAPTIIMKVEE